MSEKCKLLGNLSEGLVFVISAPAGTGKTTLVKKLLKEFPDELTRGVTCTTRAKRKVESHGEDYHFITEEEFASMKERGEFLEDVMTYGYNYGTPKKTLIERKQSRQHVILVIDTQGALQIKKIEPAVFIFIAPPSLRILHERLEERKTENTEDVKKRLTLARSELLLIEEYDYHIVNDDLETAYSVLRSIFIAEEHKQHRKKQWY